MSELNFFKLIEPPFVYLFLTTDPIDMFIFLIWLQRINNLTMFLSVCWFFNNYFGKSGKNPRNLFHLTLFGFQLGFVWQQTAEAAVCH